MGLRQIFALYSRAQTMKEIKDFFSFILRVLETSVRNELDLSRDISLANYAATNFAIIKPQTEILSYGKIMRINVFNYNYMQMINATKPILYL